MKKILFGILAITVILFSFSAQAQKKNNVKSGTHTETVAKPTVKTEAGTSTQTETDVPKPVPGTQYFIIQGTVQDFQLLLNTLDSAEPSHRDVQAMKQWIVSQVNYQVEELKKQATKKDTKDPGK